MSANGKGDPCPQKNALKPLKIQSESKHKTFIYFIAKLWLIKIILKTIPMCIKKYFIIKTHIFFFIDAFPKQADWGMDGWQL